MDGNDLPTWLQETSTLNWSSLRELKHRFVIHLDMDDNGYGYIYGLWISVNSSRPWETTYQHDYNIPFKVKLLSNKEQNTFYLCTGKYCLVARNPWRESRVWPKEIRGHWSTFSAKKTAGLIFRQDNALLPGREKGWWAGNRSWKWPGNYHSFMTLKLSNIFSFEFDCTLRSFRKM